MKLFDLHCDTALEMFLRGVGFENNGLHINLAGIRRYESVTQVMAYYCDYRLSDEEAYARFFEVDDYLKRAMESAGLPDTFRCIRAVEDARLLAGRTERLDALAARGVKILTLQWRGETCIGGGYDTDTALTDFGIEVLDKCLDHGIIPDVSHASPAGTSMIIKRCAARGKCAIASHSNALSLCRHRRNLSDEDFTLIADSGGIVGINLVPEHLHAEGKPTLDTICEHIEHFISLGGADAVALGCDLDGTDTPPFIGGIGDVYKIYDRLLARGMSAATADAVFCGNADRFARENGLL